MLILDIWKLKDVDTNESHQLVLSILDSIIMDKINNLKVRSFVSPGNRLKLFCEELNLYRDSSGFIDSCMFTCKAVLYILHSNDVRDEEGKEEM